MTNEPNRFEQDGFLFVEKGASIPDPKRWQNTGAYWSKGSTVNKRTTERRGTHKVFRNMAPALQKQAKRQQTAQMKAEIDALANRMMAADFGTRWQIKKRENGTLAIEERPEYANYNTELTEMLGKMGIGGRRVRHSTRRHKRTKRRVTYRRR